MIARSASPPPGPPPCRASVVHGRPRRESRAPRGWSGAHRKSESASPSVRPTRPRRRAFWRHAGLIRRRDATGCRPRFPPRQNGEKGGPAIASLLFGWQDRCPAAQASSQAAPSGPAHPTRQRRYACCQRPGPNSEPDAGLDGVPVCLIDPQSPLTQHLSFSLRPAGGPP